MREAEEVQCSAAYHAASKVDKAGELKHLCLGGFVRACMHAWMYVFFWSKLVQVKEQKGALIGLDWEQFQIEGSK